MASFQYLDLAIGISFIYLLLALVCSTVNESIAGILNSRGKTLAQGISELLQESALKDKIYSHPLIQGISSRKNNRLPSYISSGKFALALMDVLTGPNVPSDNPEALRAGIANLDNSATKTALTAVLDNPKLKGDQEKIEVWYEQAMDRVSGWYKRTVQIRVFVLAALVTVMMNADTLKILRGMWSNPTISSLIVESARERLQKGRPDAWDQPMVTYENPDDPTASTPTVLPERDVITSAEKQLLNQVTSWQGDWYDDWPGHQQRSFWGWIGYLLEQRLGGWLITILAVSLGAPFWFDTLKRFMNVRNAGIPPEKSSEAVPAQAGAAPTS